MPLDLSAVARGGGTSLTLRVAASYRRPDGTPAELASTVVALSDAETQQAPVTVPLGACLADAGAAGACTVVLDVSLSKGGRVIDDQLLAPLILLPGGSATASGGVRFAEVAAIRVVPRGAATAPAGQSLRVELGATVALDAALTAANGQAVTGRAVRWQSDTPPIVGVDSLSGVVTGKALGTARVMAVTAMGVGTIELMVVPQPSLVTVGSSGLGTGTVRSTPDGIVCSIIAGEARGVCATPFAADARITLTATADDRMAFTGWGGACAAAGMRPTCEIDATAARTASASFTPFREIVVSAARNGSGTVVSAPNGIQCRAIAATATGACQMSVLDGTSVTLTATPDRKHDFAGWGGACASTTAPTCVLTPNTDLTVDARFVAPPVLTLRLAGLGKGSVVVTTDDGSEPPFVCTRSTPTNLDFICSEPVAAGTRLTLTATPDSVSQFAAWDQACAGAGTCRLTVTAPTLVSATFGEGPGSVLGPLRLEVTGGIGTLSVDGVVACARNALSPYTVECTYPHHADPYDTPTVFTARPLIGRVYYWTGICSNTGGTECRVYAPGGARIGVVILDPPGVRASAPRNP